MKKRITKDLLLKDYHGYRKIFLFSIFVIAGIVVLLSPILYCSSFKNMVANMALMLLLAVPFCVLGLKNIIEASKRIKQIRQEQYNIVEDVVTHKQMMHQGKSSDTSDSYCQLSFENYSKQSGKAVIVERKVYDSSKKGDLFYMIYIDGKLLGYYPQAKYEV